MPADAKILQRLRGRIAALERSGNGVRTDDSGEALPFGVAELDGHLPWGGLAAGAVHEILDGDLRKIPQKSEKATKYLLKAKHEDGFQGAVTGFAAALAGKAQAARAAPVVWIAPRLERRESLYGPGLLEFGLDPANLVVVRIPSGSEFGATALWAMEEALRAPAVGLVCAEIEEMDLTASRRLQLAAEAGNGLGLLLRRAPRGAALPPTASVSRWRVSSLPGSPADEDERLPGRLPGRPRWRAELLRARGGRPKTWDLEWRDERTDPSRDGDAVGKTAGGFALVPPLRDRPLPQETERKAPAASRGPGLRRLRSA
ncbi:MAG: hypothetical protein JJ899_03880 [Alphaproteobacteria bacterium]|nr:hypothetical protein [Alphaproteobacteria bacterium]